MDIEPAIHTRREPDDHLSEVLEAIANGSERADKHLRSGGPESVQFKERVVPALVTLGAILLIATAHAFGWFSRPGKVSAPPVVEQNMRAMLALAVQEIEQSHEQNGAYPQHFAVADIAGDDSWRYQLLSPGHYQLILVLGVVEVSFDSEVDAEPIVPEIGSWSGGRQ